MRSTPRDPRRNGDLTMNLLKGAIAGAVGVWAMDRIDWFMHDHESAEARRRTRAARPGGRDPAHVLANQAASLVGKEVPEQHPAGLAVHYAIGMAPGALYGAYRDQFASMAGARGLLFGLGVFVVEDEVLNPALGLAGGPTRYPLSAHARGFVAHLVYGVVTDLALDLLQSATRPAGYRVSTTSRPQRLDREAKTVGHELDRVAG